MHVLIEGADGSGKSTLALEIARRLFMPVVNAIRPRIDATTDVVNMLNGYSARPTIFDRLHLSELVHGPIKRGASRFSPGDSERIEAACAAAGTFNVLCLGGHDSYVAEQFMYVANLSRLEWHEYKIGDDVEQVANMAWRKLGRRGPEPTWGQFLESPRRVQ